MPRFDVTIAGELKLDLILYGLPYDLPPERELLANGMMLTLGSSSAIVAHNLAALGSRVGFVSKIGDDPLGQIALDRLRAAGAEVDKVRRVSGSTKTGLTVILQRNDGRNILTYPGTIRELTFDDLELDYLANSRHFHVSSYYLQRGLRPRVVDLFKHLKSAGLTISLDTNDDPDDTWEGGLWEALNYVDIFLPNEREVKRITKKNDLDQAIAKLADIVPTVVVKMGKDGATARRGSEVVKKESIKVDAVDPVGAGDSFDAGFIHEFLRGSDLASCLAMGNLSGALSTTRPGGTEAFRDRDYREHFINRALEKKF